jgi:hypothetical protein
VSFFSSPALRAATVPFRVFNHWWANLVLFLLPPAATSWLVSRLVSSAAGVLSGLLVLTTAMLVSSLVTLHRATSGRELQGAKMRIGTELRDIRRKIETVRATTAMQIADGFKLPAFRFEEYGDLLAQRDPILYATVERAYVAGHRVNEAVDLRRTRAGAGHIGANEEDGWQEAYVLTGEALEALHERVDPPLETPAQTAARRLLEFDFTGDDPLGPSTEPR